MLAASASASRGELDDLILRLEAAVAMGSAEKAQVWLDTLNTQTALVEIRLQISGAVTIKPEAFIVDQSYSAALRRAEQVLLRTGEFSGRLPTGAFDIVGESIVYPLMIERGENTKIVVDSKTQSAEQEPFRYGALFIGSYNQYLRNAVIEVVRSHPVLGHIGLFLYADKRQTGFEAHWFGEQVGLKGPYFGSVECVAWAN